MLPLIAAVAFQGVNPSRIYSLMAGDPAPPLKVSSWVQGEPVTAFEKGKVYVVDFWATWCGPCKKSIPKLNELSRRFAGQAVFAGIDVWEPNADSVPAFVKSMGKDMTYPVGLDSIPPHAAMSDGDAAKFAMNSGFDSKNWLVDSGRNKVGIPTVFVVDQNGKVAWVGDDLDDLSEALPQIIDGSWPMAAYAKSYASMLSRREEGWNIEPDLEAATKRKDWKAVDALCAKIVDCGPDFQFYNIMRYENLANNLGERSQAMSLASNILSDSKNFDTLSGLGYTIAFNISSPSSDELKLAKKLVDKAALIGKGETGGTLETEARIAFLRGDTSGAVHLQKQAVAKTLTPNSKKQAQKRLDEYQKAAKH